jgi:diadenosine tetraphosphate (Ap4A) HIT family hydrolase
MLTEDFSAKNIKKNCPHCNPKSFALKHPLLKTHHFWIVCDVHPLTEGHILIIPKKHLSCIGDYPEDLFKEFIKLYSQCSEFIKKEYGSVASFEHGRIAQTVFHSHVHLLPLNQIRLRRNGSGFRPTRFKCGAPPFSGDESLIIPEGKDKLRRLKNISQLRKIFQKEGQYLFFSIGDRFWSVDLSLGKPRFFRDRFAKALGRAERGNWKEMHENPKIMAEVNQEIKNLKRCWSKSFPSHILGL